MAILTVCPSGCDYSTIGAATSAAGATDTVRLLSDITENIILNKNIAVYEADIQSRVWKSITNGSCLQANLGLTQLLTIRNITLDKFDSAGNAFLWSTYGSGAKIKFEDAIIKVTKTSGGTTQVIDTNFDIPVVDGLFIERCQIRGSGAKTSACFRSFSQTTINGIRIQNSIMRGVGAFGGAILMTQASANSVIRVFNNTIVGNIIGISLTCRADIKNNIFANNPDDISLSVNGNKLDFENNAFEEQTDTGGWGSNNIFGIISGDEFENEGTNNYHLKPGAQSIDAGANLSGIVDDDFDGNSRPSGGVWDISAYEFASDGRRMKVEIF